MKVSMNETSNFPDEYTLQTMENIVFLWKMQVLAVINRSTTPPQIKAYFLLRSEDTSNYVSIIKDKNITIRKIQNPDAEPTDLFFAADQGFIDLHNDMKAVIVGTGDLRLITLGAKIDSYDIENKKVIITAVDEFHLQLFHVNQ